MGWECTKIPKIANFYWDLSPLSLLNLLTLRSFKDLNPDWVVNLYTPKFKYETISWSGTNQKDMYTNTNYLPYIKEYCDNIIEIDFEDIGFYNTVSEVYKSDFLRWYLLSTEGGLWSDMDVLYLKPMSTLNYSKYMISGNAVDLDLTIVEERSNDYANYLIGFLLASPNNSFYKRIMDNSIKSFDTNEYQSIGNKLIRKLYPDIFDIECLHSDLSIAQLTLPVIYPYDYRDLSWLFFNSTQDLILPDTIGIHWYNADSQAKQYCNNLDLTNLGDSIMDNLLKKIKFNFK
jgi:hypothetical protein